MPVPLTGRFFLATRFFATPFTTRFGLGLALAALVDAFFAGFFVEALAPLAAGRFRPAVAAFVELAFFSVVPLAGKSCLGLVWSVRRACRAAATRGEKKLLEKSETRVNAGPDGSLARILNNDCMVELERANQVDRTRNGYNAFFSRCT